MECLINELIMELQEMSGNVVGQTDVTLDTDATKTSGVSEEVKDSTNDHRQLQRNGQRKLLWKNLPRLSRSQLKK